MKHEHSSKAFADKLKKQDINFETLLELRKVNQCLFWIQMTLFALLFIVVLK